MELSRRSLRAFTHLIVFGLILLAGTAAGLRGAAASASDWTVNTHTQVRLIAAASGVGAERTLRLGLQFKLKKGWKVYWRTPGDAGFPPRIDWAGSGNLVDARIGWPAPTRFTVLGYTTAGYKNEVIFPLEVRLAKPGETTRLRAKVDYLTCDDICVPYTVNLALTLPAGPAMTTAFAYQIDRFRARIPGAETTAGIKVERVEMFETAKGGTLTVVAGSGARFSTPDLFVEGPAHVEFGIPKVTLGDGGKRARLVVPVRKIGRKPVKVTGGLVTLTLTDGARAVEKSTVVERGAAPPPPSGGRDLVGILLLALLGGLILNLMPCVLPVLSLKLLSVVGHGGGDRAEVRRRFLATAAGVLSAFFVLAAAMVALKSAGAAVGWGIQFQQSWFLIAMAIVVTLFAANLWGLFEIRLPQTVADGAASAGVGSGGLRGEFLTGVFATLLATPCSAPFLGTAVGFSLSRGPLEIFAVFLALGIGLALPYFLVAAVPRLATMMPRPGRWMVWLRIVLGVALAATALWLLTVLAVQTGVTAAWVVGGMLIAMVVVLAFRRQVTQLAAPSVLVALLVLAVASFLAPGLLPPEVAAARATGKWQRFDQTEIRKLVASGKTVLVDVTADWCITCKANKRLVLAREPVSGLLGREVVPMIADWTRPNPVISRYLAAHGRYGIPFNIVYGPGAPDGIPLPELLTRSAVLDAIKRARGTATVQSKGTKAAKGKAAK